MPFYELKFGLRSSVAMNSRQGGAALIVSLIMLTAVTFLAVVSLQRSSIQVRMVGNSQIKQSVFDAAMSELSVQFEFMQPSNPGSGELNKALSKATVGLEGDITYEAISTPAQFKFPQHVDIGSSILYIGANSLINKGFNDDTSIEGFKPYKFMISTVASSGVSIQSNQSIGITYLAIRGGQ